LRPRMGSGLFSGAPIPEDRIEQAIAALRTDQEHEIPNLKLSLDHLRKLGL